MAEHLDINLEIQNRVQDKATGRGSRTRFAQNQNYGQTKPRYDEYIILFLTTSWQEEVDFASRQESHISDEGKVEDS